MAKLSGLIFLEIVMEIAASSGLGDVASAYDKISEPLTLVTLARVTLEDWAQDNGNLLLLGRNLI